MKNLSVSCVLLTMLAMATACFAQDNALWIDFNSLSQDNGPHHHPDYQAYDAGHEVAADFDTKDYEAFGTTVSFTPTWPDTTDNRVMQSIDRGSQQGEDEDGFPIISGHDFFWFEEEQQSADEDTTGNIDVVTDYIGVDTRTGNGGNGDYDGDTGTPTRMLFTMSGIPAGEYNWVSFHHDTEWMHGRFWLDYSTDGGETFLPAGDREFTITNSRPGGNPEAEEVYSGFDEDFQPIDLKDLPSTVNFDFETDGRDVVMQFTPLSEIAVHTQFVVVNAFQLTQTAVSVGPTCDPNTMGDLDGNGSVEFADFLILSANFGNAVDSHAQGDIDCSGDVGFPDFLVMSANFGNAVGAATSVPEPSSAGMLIGSMLLLGLCRRRN